MFVVVNFIFVNWFENNLLISKFILEALHNSHVARLRRLSTANSSLTALIAISQQFQLINYSLNEIFSKASKTTREHCFNCNTFNLFA